MDVKWEEALYWEILGFLSFLRRNPIYLAYFAYFGPRLLRMVLFFSPLLISTCLLMLIIFSLGPQLERIRIESDLQWLRFREATFTDDKEFYVMEGVERPLICSRGVSDDFIRELHGDPQKSVLLSENPLMVDRIGEEGFKVEFDRYGGVEGKSLDLSQSVILSKMGVVMDKLVAELGGKVQLQCDILNALQVIAEAFIETTQRQYEKDSMNATVTNSGKPPEEAKPLRDFSGRLVDLNDTNAGSQGEFPLIEKEIAVCRRPFTRETVPHRIDLMASKTEVDESSVDRNDAFENSVVVLESLLQESCAAKLLDTSQVSGEDNAVLGYQSESEKGLPSLENCVFRSCRIFPLDNSREELLAMDRLWEEDEQHRNTGLSAFEKAPAVKKEKDWKRTLACKLYEEQQNRWRGTLAGKFREERSSRFQTQHSPSVQIPEHQSYTDFFGAKSTSSSSDSPAFTSAESPLIAEEMDLLWEEYNDAQSHDPESKIKGLAKSLAKLRSLRGNADSDTDEAPETPKLCCLKAFRFSTGKMPLRRPNLVKFSKALKNLGLIQHIRGPKQHSS